MRKKPSSLVKIIQLILISSMMILAITIITQYSSNQKNINIARLPYENSRLANISLGYTNKKADTNYITQSYQAYLNLFAIDDLQERRQFLINYFGLANDRLYNPTIGDPIVARRFDLLFVDTALNGLNPGESFAGRLAMAAGLTAQEVKSILGVSQQIQSPDTFLKHYPNLASPEWEIFIQSQELNQLLQDFPD